MAFLYFLLVVFLILSFALPGLSLAPWVPTRKKDLKRVLELANLQPGDIFYDLGCGNGRVSFYINRYSQAASIGIELSPFFFLICKSRQLFSNRQNLKFKMKNLYREDLGPAAAVFFFAKSKEAFTAKLMNKLKRELKPGARVITYAFPLPGLKPQAVDKPDKNSLSIYSYRY